MKVAVVVVISHVRRGSSYLRELLLILVGDWGQSLRILK